MRELAQQKRRRNHFAGKAGFPAGTLTHVGSVYAEKTTIQRVDFDATGADTQKTDQWDSFLPFATHRSVSWLQISAIHDAAMLEKISQQFSIHPLVMEDVLNTTQRPKFEEFDDYLFLVMKVPFSGTSSENGTSSDDSLNFEQVSLICGKNWVLSFTETDRDLFAPVRDRIMAGKGRLRGQGSDYLTYELLDLIVDHFFTVLEDMGEAIEFLDEELVRNPGPALLRQIHTFKREMLYLHKAVWPVREIIGTFERCASPLCSSETRPYLRDVYDHVIQVIDTVETYRDLVSGMMDIYLSSISYRLNEVMKVLTIISTLFIPLTFLVGVYGMNFDNMPELRWEYGYFGLWGLMLIITFGMLRYFRGKKWL